MKDEDILEQARKESTKGLEYENRIITKSGLLCDIVMILTSMLIFILDYFISNELNAGLLLMMSSACTVTSLYLGIKLKKKSEIILGIFEAILFLIFLILYIWKLVQ